MSNDREAMDKKRHYELWFGAGMMLCGVLVLIGAWREITHHDGPLLVVCAASVMSVLSVWFARRMARERQERD